MTVSLEAAMSEVDAWLDETKLKTGKCSRILRKQLAEAMSHRTTSVFAVFDEIGQLEGSDPPRPTGTKAAAPLTRGLTGLVHQHYRVSSLASFALNQRNHWRRKENRAKLDGIADEFRRTGDSGKLVHELVLGAHMGRHSAGQTTGEWIVYAIIAGVNYYLTLATHQEPDEDAEKHIRECFSEFPQLRAHLGW